MKTNIHFLQNIRYINSNCNSENEQIYFHEQYSLIFSSLTPKVAFNIFSAEPHSSVGSVADLRIGSIHGSANILSEDFYDSHCKRIHSSLTAVRFDNGYVGKQPVAWKEYWAEYWLKELQESIDRCTGRRDITEILLKSALNTIQSISH